MLAVVIMLILLWVGVAGAFYLIANGKIGTSAEERAKTTEVQRTAQLQKEANDFMARREYIKDPVTGLCFALFPAMRIDGTPAFTNVPCDTIPAALLITGELPGR